MKTSELKQEAKEKNSNTEPQKKDSNKTSCCDPGCCGGDAKSKKN